MSLKFIGVFTLDDPECNRCVVTSCVQGLDMDKILGSSDSAPPGPFFSRRELDRATNSSYNNMTRSHAMSLISRLIMLCCVSLLQTLKVINHRESF